MAEASTTSAVVTAAIEAPVAVVTAAAEAAAAPGKAAVAVATSTVSFVSRMATAVSSRIGPIGTQLFGTVLGAVSGVLIRVVAGAIYKRTGLRGDSALGIGARLTVCGLVGAGIGSLLGLSAFGIVGVIVTVCGTTGVTADLQAHSGNAEAAGNVKPQHKDAAKKTAKNKGKNKATADTTLRTGY